MSCFKNFEPMASATTYGPRTTFVGAKQWATTTEGENCGYNPTLGTINDVY